MIGFIRGFFTKPEAPFIEIDTAPLIEATVIYISTSYDWLTVQTKSGKILKVKLQFWQGVAYDIGNVLEGTEGKDLSFNVHNIKNSKRLCLFEQEKT